MDNLLPLSLARFYPNYEHNNCVREKEFDTCADCGQMDECPTPGQIAVNSPFVPENLNRLREAKKNKIN